MSEPVRFPDEITLTKAEVLDVIARCDEVAALAGAAGQVEIEFAVEGVGRFLFGRLLGEPGGWTTDRWGSLRLVAGGVVRRGSGRRRRRAS